MTLTIKATSLAWVTVQNFPLFAYSNCFKTVRAMFNNLQGHHSHTT
jgi:hypothetical protein